MKKIFSFVCIAAISLLALSCQKGGSQMPEKYQPATPLSYEGPGAVEFTSEGGSSHLIVSSSAAVEATSSAAWLQVEISGKNVYLTAPANETLIARYSTLTLVSGGKSRDVQVKQYGVTSDYLWDDEYEFPYTGGEINLKHHPTTATVRVQVEGKDWISVAVGAESLDITIAKNDATEAREGSVTWSAGEDVRVMAIKQAANPGGGGGGGGESGEVIFFEDFESDAPDWLFGDLDQDGYGWSIADFDGVLVHSGSCALLSNSYVNNVGAVEPDNWAFTPAIDFTSGNYLSFWVGAQDPDWYEEHLAVYVMASIPETAADIDALTPVWEKTLSTPDMTQIVVAIPADMANKSGYVAFRHYDCTDMFEINLDDVAVTVGEPSAAPIFSAPSVHSTALSPLARRK